MTDLQFKDRFGKIWDLKLDLGKTLLVDASDFESVTKSPIILSRYDKDTVVEMLTDTPVMFAVIGVIVRDQFASNLKEKLPASDPPLAGDELESTYQGLFVSSIDGSVIEPARDALVNALKDFFPAATTALSIFLLKIREYQKNVSERLTTEILPLLNPKINQIIDKEFEGLKKRLEETSLPLSQS